VAAVTQCALRLVLCVWCWGFSPRLRTWWVSALPLSSTQALEC
jgi:hypothetical protein